MGKEPESPVSSGAVERVHWGQEYVRPPDVSPASPIVWAAPRYPSAPGMALSPMAFRAAPPADGTDGPLPTAVWVAAMPHRMAAFLIDLIIIVAVYASVGFGLSAVGVSSTPAFFISLLLPIVYLSWANGVAQRTVGKRLLKLKVVDLDHGGPLGFASGVARTLVLGSLAVFFLRIFFSPWWDPRRLNRGWHDRTVNSVVVNSPFRY